MDAHDRKLYVQILAQMLIADGVLADEEREHLDRLVESLNMPAEEADEALRGVSIDSPVEERVAALSDEVKSGLLTEVERALNLDGKLTRSEEYFLDRVRKLVG